jgi:hypothetical protein
MELEIQREPSDEKRTFGTLWIDGVYECETLEDPVREEKISGRTAIPTGHYRISMENSPRFGQNTITINDVPNFTSVRIHAGNTENDTEGCPLVGQERTETTIIKSKLALAHLKAKVREGLNAGEVWLTIFSA